MQLPSYTDQILEYWQLLTGVLAIVLIATYLVIKQYLARKVHLLSKRTQNQPLKLFVKYWLGPLLLCILIIIIHVILPSAIKKQDSYIHVLEIIKIIIFTLFTIRIISTLKKIITNRHTQYLHNFSVRCINTQINILVKITIVVIALVGASLVIMTFPQIRKLGISILTSAGIMGIALGFAAQRSLGNIWAGIQIAFTQPIRIGDKVVVENEVGTIETINLTYVVMRTIGNRKLIIPINHFNEKIFQNWTRSSLDLLAVITMEVDYIVPVYEIREELDKILEQTNLWDKKTKTFQVINIKFNAIELRIMVSAARASDAQELQHYIREKLINFIQQNRPCLFNKAVAFICPSNDLKKDCKDSKGIAKEDMIDKAPLIISDNINARS